MTDIVADLHVLDAFGGGEGDRAEKPALPGPAAADHQSRRDVQHPLERDRPMDVGGVFRAEAVLDVGADRVELTSERLDVCFIEMGVDGDLADSQWMFLGLMG